MGCIYNDVCSSLVALFLWQQVTHLAAVMAHWYFTQQIWEIGCFYFFVGMCNLREIWISNMVIHFSFSKPFSISSSLSLSFSSSLPLSLSLCFFLSLGLSIEFNSIQTYTMYTKVCSNQWIWLFQPHPVLTVV